MRERVRENGVVGAGGAGFPSYVKLEKSAEIVIMNAAECEPLLHKDKQVLNHYKDEVVAGMAKVMQQVGASRGVIGIKVKYTELIAELREVAAPYNIEVFELGDFYPAGDEFITVFEITQRVIPPGGIPLDVGCLVMNVETFLNIERDQPVTEKFLSIAGHVPEPVTVKVPVGIRFGDVLRGVGVDLETVDSVLVGGVMMGSLMESYDQVVTRTTGALICFPEGHRLPQRYQTQAPSRDAIGRSACDQCSFCTEMCPRYLLGHPVEPHLAMRGLQFNMAGDSLVLGSQFCCECNLCSLYACPEDLYPKDACADNKRFMRAEKFQHPYTGKKDVKPHSMQEFRHIPVSSLMKKLGLWKFRNVGPLVEVDWQFKDLKVPLKMHIGAPAVSRVQPGDMVQVEQVIADAPDGLGVPIHSPINGRVTAVGDDVVIEKI